MSKLVVSCNSTYRLRYWNVMRALFFTAFATAGCNSTYRLRYWNYQDYFAYFLISWIVATVLTVYGIETFIVMNLMNVKILRVATVLTVYGIETYVQFRLGVQFFGCNSTYRLRYWNTAKKLAEVMNRVALQQYLPFTVLKLLCLTTKKANSMYSCNSTYRLRYWNFGKLPFITTEITITGCNSTYRLRYWNEFKNFTIELYVTRCNSTYRLRYWNFREEKTMNKKLNRCNSTYRLRYWNAERIPFNFS